MSNRFQGDPKIKITADGMDLDSFLGGQPKMEKGLSNAVLLSLFTKPGWWGTAFLGCEKIKGSNFLDACNQSITVKTINNIRQAAEKALAWIPGTVSVWVGNPTGSKIEIIITVQPPGEELQKFLLSRDGLNWFYTIYMAE